MPLFNWASTGHAGLDKILQHLQAGDNVVWQVEAGSNTKHKKAAPARERPCITRCRGTHL
ncbi:MAG: hypothetical protein ACM3WV_08910 [Bacillota bacterium]